MAKRLLVLALRLVVALGVSAAALYVGLVYFEDVFERVIYTIAPPLLAFGGLAENRTKRKLLGLPNARFSRRQLYGTVAIVIAYGVVVWTWFERFESFFVIVPILAAFGYCIWLGSIARRDHKLRENDLR